MARQDKANDFAVTPTVQGSPLGLASGTGGARNYVIGFPTEAAYTFSGENNESGYPLVKSNASIWDGRDLIVSYDLILDADLPEGAGLTLQGNADLANYARFAQLTGPAPAGVYHRVEARGGVYTGGGSKATMRLLSDGYKGTVVLKNVGVYSTDHDWMPAPEDLMRNTVTEIAADADMDQLLTAGNYAMSGVSGVINLPDGYQDQANWAQVIVSDTGGFISQQLIISNGDLFARTRSGKPAAWSEWLKH